MPGGVSINRRRVLPAVITIIGLVVLAVLAGIFADPGRDAGSNTGSNTGSGTRSTTATTAGGVGGRPLAVSSRGCARGVGPLRSGRNVLRLANAGNSPEEVAVLDKDHRYAYGELEMIAPGTTRSLTVILPPGRFGLSCEADDGTIGYSDPIVVSGPPVSGAHRWIPATAADLGNVITRYRAKVSAGLARLAADTDALRTAAAAGHRDVIKKRWLTAHLDYERLGAAYGTFGEFADKIDGLPNGLRQGVTDPGFTGFHKIEYLLWQHGTDDQVRAAVGRLDTDVHALVKNFPHQITAPNDVPLRTHEILENTLQLTLTGQDDLGSNSTLATVAANIDGTRMTLAALTPLLEQNDPALLTSARAAVDRLDRVLAGLRTGGTWPALRSLSPDQRRRLSGTLSGTLESLAPIPTELEVLTTHDDS